MRWEDEYTVKDGSGEEISLRVMNEGKMKGYEGMSKVDAGCGEELEVWDIFGLMNMRVGEWYFRKWGLSIAKEWVLLGSEVTL